MSRLPHHHPLEAAPHVRLAPGCQGCGSRRFPGWLCSYAFRPRDAPGGLRLSLPSDGFPATRCCPRLPAYFGDNITSLVLKFGEEKKLSEEERNSMLNQVTFVAMQRRLLPMINLPVSITLDDTGEHPPILSGLRPCIFGNCALTLLPRLNSSHTQSPDPIALQGTSSPSPPASPILYLGLPLRCTSLVPASPRSLLRRLGSVPCPPCKAKEAAAPPRQHHQVCTGDLPRRQH